MSEEDFLETMEAIRQARERCKTPEDARRALIRTGILTEDGELAPEYQ